MNEINLDEKINLENNIKETQTTQKNPPHPKTTTIKEKKQIGKKEGKKKQKRQKQYLEKRDLLLMVFCYEQYFLVRNQMLNWLMAKYDFKNAGSADIAMRRILGILKRLNLVNISRSGFLDYREIFVINERGVRALKDKGYLPEYAVNIDLDETKLSHDYMTTEVRLILEKVINCKEWVSDRLLRCKNHLNIPDAEITYFSPKANRDAKISVEVEMTQKSKERYKKKLTDYQKSHYDLLFYFANQESIKEAILGESKGITQMAYICLIDELLTKQQKVTMVSNDDELVLGERFQTPINSLERGL